MDFKLIVAMTKADRTDEVIDAAKDAGGTGATIVHASGTGIHEAKTFFGLNLEVQTDVLLFVVADSVVQSVLDAIEQAGRFAEPGSGIALVVPLEQVIGLDSQLNHYRREEQRRS